MIIKWVTLNDKKGNAIIEVRLLDHVMDFPSAKLRHIKTLGRILANESDHPGARYTFWVSVQARLATLNLSPEDLEHISSQIALRIKPLTPAEHVARQSLESTLYRQCPFMKPF